MNGPLEEMAGPMVCDRVCLGVVSSPVTSVRLPCLMRRLGRALVAAEFLLEDRSSLGGYAEFSSESLSQYFAFLKCLQLKLKYQSGLFGTSVPRAPTDTVWGVISCSPEFHDFRVRVSVCQVHFYTFFQVWVQDL